MEFTVRLCCLLPACLACVLLHCHLGESVYIPPKRCACPEANNFIREPIETFFINEMNEYCKKDEIIVTLKRNNQEVCLNPEKLQGKRLINCWKRNNKDDSQNKMCVIQRRKELPAYSAE